MAKVFPDKSILSKLINHLDEIYQSARFLCDGYLIHAEVGYFKNRVVVYVYVNGEIKGSDWWRGYESEFGSIPEIPRKFQNYVSRLAQLRGALESKGVSHE